MNFGWRPVKWIKSVAIYSYVEDAYILIFIVEICCIIQANEKLVIVLLYILQYWSDFIQIRISQKLWSVLKDSYLNFNMLILTFLNKVQFQTIYVEKIFDNEIF